MVLFDILIWMAVAKIAVLLLEDTAYAVRGKQSPRRRERAAHRAAEAAGQPTPRTTGNQGRIRSAIGGYLAGAVEDATAKARARKRRARARAAGTRAVDGVFVDLTDDDGFYADCDVCGWSSRRYRIEANALAAGREHTRSEHPDLYQPDPEPQPAPATAEAAEAAENTEPAENTEAAEAQGGRPPLRVIPGGRDKQEPDEPASPVVHDDHTYCLTPKCPVCRPLAGTHGWTCGTCGLRREGFASADAEGLRRCMVPDPDHGHGVCGLYVVPGTNFCIGHQGSDLPVTALDADDPRWRCPFPTADGPCGAAPQWNDRHCLQHRHLAEATQTPAAGNPADDGKERSTTVNLDATGPEEIRAAFSQAADTAGEKAEEITGLAGVLAEAADRFENLRMAATTVEHMRDASEAFQAAKALLDNAQESLQNALADFNSKDGHVADTVADTGGNLADQDVLVGG